MGNDSITTYAEQLRDRRWITVRERILERDFYMCQRCMSSHKLQVHHKYYIIGRMAWDYQDDALITLCASCHENEHLYNKIKTRETDDKIPKLMRFIGESMNALLILKSREDGEEVH